MWHRFTNAVLQPEFQAWFRPVVPNLFRLVYHQLNSALPGVSLSLKYPLVHFTILPVWSTQVGPEVLVPLLGNHWFRRSWATESWCAVRERFVIFERLFFTDLRVMIILSEWLVQKFDVRVPAAKCFIAGLIHAPETCSDHRFTCARNKIDHDGR